MFALAQAQTPNACHLYLGQPLLLFQELTCKSDCPAERISIPYTSGALTITTDLTLLVLSSLVTVGLTCVEKDRQDKALLHYSTERMTTIGGTAFCLQIPPLFLQMLSIR